MLEYAKTFQRLQAPSDAKALAHYKEVGLMLRKEELVPELVDGLHLNESKNGTVAWLRVERVQSAPAVRPAVPQGLQRWADQLPVPASPSQRQQARRGSEVIPEKCAELHMPHQRLSVSGTHWLSHWLIDLPSHWLSHWLTGCRTMMFGALHHNAVWCTSCSTAIDTLLVLAAPPKISTSTSRQFGRTGLRERNAGCEG